MPQGAGARASRARLPHARTPVPQRGVVYIPQVQSAAPPWWIRNDPRARDGAGACFCGQPTTHAGFGARKHASSGVGASAIHGGSRSVGKQLRLSPVSKHSHLYRRNYRRKQEWELSFSEHSHHGLRTRIATAPAKPASGSKHCRHHCCSPARSQDAVDLDVQGGRMAVSNRQLFEEQRRIARRDWRSCKRRTRRRGTTGRSRQKH